MRVVVIMVNDYPKRVVTLLEGVPEYQVIDRLRDEQREVQIAEFRKTHPHQIPADHPMTVGFVHTHVFDLEVA